MGEALVEQLLHLDQGPLRQGQDVCKDPKLLLDRVSPELRLHRRVSQCEGEGLLQGEDEEAVASASLLRSGSKSTP